MKKLFLIAIAATSFVAYAVEKTEEPKDTTPSKESTDTKGKSEANDKRVVITKDNWAAEVEKSAKPVLVDFWAPWCGPCKLLDPIVKDLASTNSDIKFAKLNVDDNEALSEKFKISAIPCVVIMKDGKEVARHVGLLKKEDLVEFIKKNTAK